MKSKPVLCEGVKCPICEDCERYRPDLDRTNTPHFDPIPYDHARMKCGFFMKKEPDIFQQLNIITNYEEKRDPFPDK